MKYSDFFKVTNEFSIACEFIETEAALNTLVALDHKP
jgi:hypothetical protein